MRSPSASPSRSRPLSWSTWRPGLSFSLLLVLLGTLWIAGGASRSDAFGQVVVRAVAWSLLVVLALFGERPSLRQMRPVLLLLAAALLLALAQLVPVPPAMWQALPGRAVFAEAAAASGQPQPWRPWSIVPGATVNALSSLVVPFATLLLVAGLKERERGRLPGLLLGLILLSALLGLLQFASGGLDNPFVNDAVGAVSGTFANRNHFALLVAFGCLLAPVWAFGENAGRHRPGWRGPVAFCLILLFVPLLLVVGSRAGVVFGALALVIGLLLARRGLRRELARYPRWAFPALIAGVLALVAIIVLVSIAADRSVSINRLLEADQGQDMRARGLPTVLAMIRAYFPWGSGLGGFDPMFRMHEPFGLLKFTYFNHAHNDLLEVALDAGLPGLLVLLAAMLWWVRATVRAWGGDPLALAGSTMLLLTALASLVDYPARTPLMMAVAVIAAAWLSGRDGAVGPRQGSGAALPPDSQHL